MLRGEREGEGALREGEGEEVYASSQCRPSSVLAWQGSFR